MVDITGITRRQSDSAFKFPEGRSMWAHASFIPNNSQVLICPGFLPTLENGEYVECWVRTIEHLVWIYWETFGPSLNLLSGFGTARRKRRTKVDRRWPAYRCAFSRGSHWSSRTNTQGQSMSVRASGFLPMKSILPNRYIVLTPHIENSGGSTAARFICSVCNGIDLMLSLPCMT